MSILPFNSSTNNVQNATLLAGINPQQLLFGGSGLTNNPTLNGILSTFQTGSLTGFSPDTFNFSGLGNQLNTNPLLPTGTGGTSTGNIFLGTTGLPNPLTGTGGTSTTTPNPLTGTGGTSTTTANPLTGTGGTSTLLTNSPLNGTQNLAAIQNQSQNPAFTSNLVIPPSSIGLGGTTGLAGTTIPNSSSPVIGQLGLNSGTTTSGGGLSQILMALVQMLTQLAPTLLAAQPPAATPPKTEDPEIADLKEQVKELKQQLKETKDDPPKEEDPPKTEDPPKNTDDQNIKPSLADRAKVLDKTVFDVIWNFGFAKGSNNAADVERYSGSEAAKKVPHDLFDYIFNDGFKKGSNG